MIERGAELAPSPQGPCARHAAICCCFCSRSLGPTHDRHEHEALAATAVTPTPLRYHPGSARPGGTVEPYEDALGVCERRRSTECWAP